MPTPLAAILEHPPYLEGAEGSPEVEGGGTVLFSFFPLLSLLLVQE